MIYFSFRAMVGIFNTHINRPLLTTFPAVCRSAPGCPPYTSLLSAVNCRADRRTPTGRAKAHRHTNTQILSDNTPRLSVNSPKVFCITPKVLKNALAAHREVSRSNLSPAGLPDSFVVGGDYKIAACLSSFLMALLMKSLIVVPVVATKAATRECNSDDIRKFNLPLYGFAGSTPSALQASR